MRRGWMALLALVIGLVPAIGVLLPQTAVAADVVVQDGGAYDCTREGLANAITAAEGSRVTFDCATPQIDITSPITITGNVTIDGSNSEGGDPIILDGGRVEGSPNSGNQIFNITSSGGLTLQHLTIQHGHSDVSGGAILNRGTLTIRYIVFNDNLAGSEFNSIGSGGAIYNNGMLTINQSTFSNNATLGIGGAIFNNFDGKLEISQSSFTVNSADTAGTIWNQGTTEISQSSFTDNSAGDDAGAILSASTLTVDSSTFSGNTASDNSSTFSFGPSATASTLRWSTIVQPPGATQALQAFSPLTLEGVILAGPGDNCAISGNLVTDSYTLSDDDSCDLSTSANGGTSIVDEGLAIGQPASLPTGYDVTQTYYPPLQTSPAVNAGGDGCATVPGGETGPALDQIGNTRPQRGACDIGAIETSLIPADPVDLCANRWTGDLRMPPYGRCASTETLLALPDDGPLTLCANRWTGEARYSEYERCRSTETSYEATGTDTVAVCINRWTGDLRVSARCYTTERSDQL